MVTSQAGNVTDNVNSSQKLLFFLLAKFDVESKGQTANLRSLEQMCFTRRPNELSAHEVDLGGDVGATLLANKY